MSALGGQLALSLTAPMLAGVVALRALGVRWRSDPLAFAGWAWLTGASIVAALTLCWVALGKPVAGVWLAPAVLVTAAVLLVATKRERATVAPERGAARLERWLFGATVVALLVLVVVTSLATSTAPVLFGDEAAIWAAKAKALYGASGWTRLHQDLQLRVFHPDYPMLNPLLQTWVFAGAGTILDFHGRLPIHMCTVALLCVLGAMLRRTLRPALAAALLLLFFTQGVVILEFERGNADLMVALGAIASLDGWLRARSGDVRGWRLACIGLTVLVSSKNEGIALALLLTTWFVLDRRRLPHSGSMALGWLALPGAAVAVTAAFAVALGVSNDIIAWDDPGPFFARLLHRAAQGTVVAKALAREALSADSRWLVLCFLGLVLLLPRRLARSAAMPIAAIAVASLAIYLVVFVATPHDLGWHLVTAGGRLVFHVSAIAIVGLALALAALWPRLGNRGSGPEPSEARAETHPR